MHSYLGNFVLLLVLAQLSSAASTISTFTDLSCTASLRSLSGPNGFPNGTCTDLRRNGPYGSFHIISLDPGCTVTIYKDDNTHDICSGQADFAAPLKCYNSEYVYYSIDFCDPGAIQSSVPTPSTSPQNHTAAIVGGVLGSILGLAIIAGIAFWVWWRKRRAGQQANAAQGDDDVPVGELQAQERSELAMGKEVYKQEAVEVEAPPVEIGSSEFDPNQRPVASKKD